MSFSTWLKTKQATTVFALAALGGGFFFLKNNITGNVILNETYTFNLVSLVGLLLISCSLVLGAYTIRKK